MLIYDEILGKEVEVLGEITPENEKEKDMEIIVPEEEKDNA